MGKLNVGGRIKPLYYVGQAMGISAIQIISYQGI